MTKSAESKEGKSEGLKGSPTVPALVNPQDKSDQVAEKVGNILRAYHNSKGMLFYFLEAKKIYNNGKGPLSAREYLEKMESVLRENMLNMPKN